MTIPTTAGSGSEVSHAAIITDTDARRKLELGVWEFVADLTIVDPMFSAHMPRQLTADTGIDVLTRAVEVYNHAWFNDFTNGLCLQAVWMVFRYLTRATKNGEADAEARTKMANAATIAGAIRNLLQQIGQPVRLKDAGISQPDFEAELEALCDRAEIDLGIVMTRRYPGRKDLKRLFEYAFDGRAVDF